MYDELVKALRNMFRAYKATDNENCRHAKTILQAADAIEQLSKQHEAQRQNLIALINERPKWIPVTKRPPEADEEVFIYLWDRPSPYIAWVDPEGRWETNDFYIDVEDTPKAWMPLPKPPKEET